MAPHTFRPPLTKLTKMTKTLLGVRTGISVNYVNFVKGPKDLTRITLTI